MSKCKSDAEQIVNEVFSLYKLHGNKDYIGEPVSQIEHMSQTAAFAEEEGNDDEVVLAAFFHDIGHLCAANVATMGGMGNLDHEQLGADYLLEKCFSERIANLVQGHVVAKRYLTYKNPAYLEKLSLASRATLNFQGGPMGAEEAAEFDKNPDASLMVRMRYWDDEAKKQNQPVDNVMRLKQMAVKHLKQRMH